MLDDPKPKEIVQGKDKYTICTMAEFCQMSDLEKREFMGLPSKKEETDD